MHTVALLVSAMAMCCLLGLMLTFLDLLPTLLLCSLIAIVTFVVTVSRRGR